MQLNTDLLLKYVINRFRHVRGLISHIILRNMAFPGTGEEKVNEIH